MITLYLYPEMFGLPDNNPFGLKVDTFLRLTDIDYEIEHILDTKNAPRKQLPYIKDENKTVTDSNHIIDYLSQKHSIELDRELTTAQKNLHFLIVRMLDNHLYWVMSYSRWQDERFWPLFKAEFLKQFPQTAESTLLKARDYNMGKYLSQGIGRYDTEAVYQSGIKDLQAINVMLASNDFLFGKQIHTLDACCFGFLANIYYFDIDTPLKDFINKENTLKQYIERIRALLNY